MAGGALEQMTRLLDQSAGMQRQAFDAANAAQDEYVSALQRPRSSNLPALQMAAGLLAPTRTGSFFEGLGKGVSGYADALGKQEDQEMDRTAKIAQLKLAKANLLGSFGQNQLQNGMQRFKLPGLALESEEATQDYNDLISGKSDVPTFGTPGEPGGDPLVTPPRPNTPAPVPTSEGQPLPAPNANVAALDPVAIQAQINASGGSDALLGGEGEDDLSGSFGDAQLQGGSGQDQMQLAQAQAGAKPGGAPAPAMPQPNMQQQLYNWAQQVRAAAAQNPRRWARRKENVFALQQADKIIDDYRAAQSAMASQSLSEERFRILKERQDLQKAQQEAKEGKPTEKMRSDLAVARRAAQALDTELDNYVDLVGRTGAEVLPTESKAELNTAYTNLLMRLKNVYELGAITGPDEKLLNQLLMNPAVNEASIADATKWINPQGRVKTQVQALRKMIKNDLDAAEKNLLGNKQPVGGGNPNTDSAVGETLTPEQEAALEELLRRKRARGQ